MKFDMMVQKIAHELHTLYQTGIGETAVNTFSQFGRHGLYDNLFDFLIKEGHKIEFDRTIKKQLYQLAIKTFNEERKSWVQSGIMSEEGMKTECNKFYKSYLVRKYLLDHYTATGEMLSLNYEDGSKVRKISFGNIK